MTNTDYQQWRQRAAQELVYWTALQPGEDGYEHHKQGLFDHTECYLNHVQKGKLCTTLYPEAKNRSGNQRKFLQHQWSPEPRDE